MSEKRRTALDHRPTTAVVAAPGDDVPIAGEAVVEGVRLSPLERHVLTRVNGRRSCEEIARQVDLTAREVAAVIARLREVGAIEPAVDVILDADWE